MKAIVHAAVCWYLRKCGGAFHHYEYGPNGRYVVLMSDQQYHRYSKVRDRGRYCEDPSNCTYADCPTAFCDKS